jgi:quinol monooxygenase YgiN
LRSLTFTLVRLAHRPCGAVQGTPQSDRLPDGPWFAARTPVELGTVSKSQDVRGRTVSELMGIARFRFHEGKLDEYKRLSVQAMEIVRTKDTGTLQYDTYFNDDQSECVVIERYRDSEAAMEHAANLSDLSAAVLDIVSVVHGELLGEPSDELRARLADSELPVLFTPYESM